MKHYAQIQTEFVRYAKMDAWTAYHSFENYVKGKKFISPKTRNLVDFYSLPRSMQRLIKSKFDKERDKTILRQIERVRNTQYGPQMAFA